MRPSTSSSCRHAPQRAAAAASSHHRATPRRAPPLQRAAAAPASRLPTLRALADEEGGPSTSAPPADAGIDCNGTGVEAACIVRDEGGAADAPTTTTTTSPPPPQPPASLASTLASTALLISPFFFWGSSMTAMKVLEPHTTPLFVAAVRLIPAGAALIAWADAQGRPRPSGADAWRAIAVFALVDGALFQGCLAEGLRRTSAGLGSVIIDSQPLTVAALSALLYGEALPPAGVVGLGVGVAGLCLLEVPPSLLAGAVPALAPWLGGGGEGGADAAAAAAAATTTALTAASATTSPDAWSVWQSGEWWMLCAAQAMALGTVLVPWVSRFADPVQATGWHLLLGGLPLAALAAVREGPELIARLPALTATDVGLLAYVSLLGSAASYGVFFYNASRGSLTRLSALTFLTPAFAAGTGFLVLGERLGPLQILGAVVTLGAVALISQVGKKKEE
jgi:drug/metabolite transporter (DMT)-like permease